MTDFSALDRPVWSALSTAWAPLAIANGHSRRLISDYGPFAATDDPQDLSPLLPLVRAHGAAWVVEHTGALPIPSGLVVERQAELVQMVRVGSDLPELSEECAKLTSADAEEMRALALLTEPGPFAAKTNLLGDFYAIKRDGRIAAMAGERMHFPGFAEVSGVCTHPDHRNRGLSTGPTAAVVHAIVTRGDVPFLHCYPSNKPAISLYERLGFAVRRTLVVTILAAG